MGVLSDYNLKWNVFLIQHLDFLFSDSLYSVSVTFGLSLLEVQLKASLKDPPSWVQPFKRSKPLKWDTALDVLGPGGLSLDHVASDVQSTSQSLIPSCLQTGHRAFLQEGLTSRPAWRPWAGSGSACRHTKTKTSGKHICSWMNSCLIRSPQT